jgi:prepilin-type N-terminal cleavage/methylation domain-containing protein
MKKGFTLVELLIVMTIVILLLMMAIGVINPIAMVNRGHDAKRKDDLAKIKLAFEEYYSDKSCYPSGSVLSDLMSQSNCNSNAVFGSWIKTWPCDPSTRQPYYIYVGQPEPVCPQKFMVYANLQNHNDKDIPPNFYSAGYILAEGNLGTNQANYGVSSLDVLWYSLP